MLFLDTRQDRDLVQTTSAPSAAAGKAPGEAVYLQPGDLHVGATPCLLTTIVGSCVAVCVHDPGTRVGGANHYLLPYNLNSGEALRYGAVSIPRLVDEVLRLGARKGHLEAKIFGGACMLVTQRRATDHLGVQNVQLAYRLLAQCGIPVVAHDTEGNRARRIFFRTDDGAVWLKRL